MLKVAYPIELYGLSIFVPVVGFQTSALLTLQEWNVPTFLITEGYGVHPEFSLDWMRMTFLKADFIIKEYAMPYEKFLEIDSSKPFAELRMELEGLQKKILASKPKLSENAEFHRLFPLENETEYVLQGL